MKSLYNKESFLFMKNNTLFININGVFYPLLFFCLLTFLFLLASKFPHHFGIFHCLQLCDHLHLQALCCFFGAFILSSTSIANG
ncbi:hypothetical protein HOB94_07295 [bacterium]|nr:hypothetical protein [bacterium]